MHTLFGFCLRFFAGFIAAKLLLRPFGADHTGWLLGLALLLTLNLYWLDYKEIRQQIKNFCRRLRWAQKHNTKTQPLSLPAPPDPPAQP